MKRSLSIVALLLIGPVGATARSASRPPGAQSASHAADATVLESLDRWKAAVLAGNESAIAAFYSSAPPAQAQTPQGKTADPAEEPRFWSAIAAQGISRLNPKVLEILHPQPGAAVLNLRVELTLRTSSGEQPLVMSVMQAWIDQGGAWRILVSQRSDMVANPARSLPEPSRPNTDLYPPPEEARSEIAAALASAAKDHKRVILVFGGNWCYDCHVLDATFHSKAIAPLVNANFHVVHVNIGEEYDKNLDLAAKYQVPLKKGVPALVVLDPGGKLVYSQQAGEFENTTRVGPADVTAFLKKWAPPVQN